MPILSLLFGCASRRQPVAKSTPPHNFSIAIKLSSKETVERLERLRYRLKYSDSTIRLLLRSVQGGHLLEEQLLSLFREIETTNLKLKKYKGKDERVAFAKPVILLEQLVGQLGHHLVELQCCAERSTSPNVDCRIEALRLADVAKESEAELRRMRCELRVEMEAAVTYDRDPHNANNNNNPRLIKREHACPFYCVACAYNRIMRNIKIVD